MFMSLGCCKDNFTRLALLGAFDMSDVRGSGGDSGIIRPREQHKVQTIWYNSVSMQAASLRLAVCSLLYLYPTFRAFSTASYALGPGASL